MDAYVTVTPTPSEVTARTTMANPKRLSKLYSLMQSIEGKLGGGEGVEGIYGSITSTGMQKIFSSMHNSCNLDRHSTLVDIGAGLGRPLLHSLLDPGVKGAFGIELDHVKVAKAEAFMRQTMDGLARYENCEQTLPLPDITCTSIEEVPTLEPATHAYSFWEGVPLSGKEAFGRLFEASRSLKAVAVVQRSMRGEDPARMMADLGFGPLLLITNFPVKMSGSGRSFQAYIFSKIMPGAMDVFRNPTPHRPAALPAAAAAVLDAAEPQERLAAADTDAPPRTPASHSPYSRFAAAAAAATEEEWPHGCTITPLSEAVVCTVGAKRSRAAIEAASGGMEPLQARSAHAEPGTGTGAKKQRTLTGICRATKSTAATLSGSKAAAAAAMAAFNMTSKFGPQFLSGAISQSLVGYGSPVSVVGNVRASSRLAAKAAAKQLAAH